MWAGRAVFHLVTQDPRLPSFHDATVSVVSFQTMAITISSLDSKMTPVIVLTVSARTSHMVQYKQKGGWVREGADGYFVGAAVFCHTCLYWSAFWVVSTRK